MLNSRAELIIVSIISRKPAVVDVVIDHEPNPDDFRVTARKLTDT